MCIRDREDAARLGIKKGDVIELFTGVGAIEVKANPSARVLPGICLLYTSSCS